MERAVCLVFEHRADHESQWAAIVSIAAKIGCTAETLRKRVRQHERDTGRREGPTRAEQQHIVGDLQPEGSGNGSVHASSQMV